jgi:hypothetical protein
MNEVLQFIEENVYPYPIGNDVSRVKNHFDALKKYIPELKGFALFDNLNRSLENNQDGLLMVQWSRKEIENYIPIPQTLYKFVENSNYGEIWKGRFIEIVNENIPPAAIKNVNHSFWKTTKISDEFLIPIFEKFYDEAALPRGLMDKSKFYLLVEYVDKNLLDNEIQEVISKLYKHFTK